MQNENSKKYFQEGFHIKKIELANIQIILILTKFLTFFFIVIKQISVG